MNRNFSAEDHVLPRPVERLPEYAHAKARQTLADRFTAAFGLSSNASSIFANCVVDPAAVRKAIGDPEDPQAELLSVPGGTILGIRTEVWSRRVMPDPRNPRTLPSRCHPIAVDPGAGAENTKFRPLGEPTVKDPNNSQGAELVVKVESRDQLTWASQQAASYVAAENDWSESIASQGVMEAVWLAAMTFEHEDGCVPVTAAVTVEGSSRITGVHSNLGIRSADLAYEDSDARIRAQIRKLNDALERGPTAEELIALRCERVPALLLVGFRPHRGGTTAFSTAVKSLVALRHVDPPTPWGEGPENESLADEALDEMYRRDLISAAQRTYYGGACTKAEARAAHLSDDPTVRAAAIVNLFTSRDQRFAEAIRVAVTSQSTRKRITPKLLNQLATALIMRSVADDRGRSDQIRRYMQQAFGQSVHRGLWESTNRPVEQLVQKAMGEVREWISEQTREDPGPASLELSVRGAYALVVSGRLNADRGSVNNDQPDRRTPGEVLDNMRRTPQGVHQLSQALKDFGAGRGAIRAVDEDGNVKQGPGGIEQSVNDVYLRSEFPPPGKARAPRPGDTVMDRYHNALSAFSTSVGALEQSFQSLARVLGDDGRAVVDSRGVDPSSCSEWRDLLRTIDEELVVWARTYRRAFRESVLTPVPAEQEEGSPDGYLNETHDADAPQFSS